MFRRKSFLLLLFLNALLCGMTLLSRSLGQTELSFERTDFEVGHLPNSIHVGDFNGDEIQDLAVANSGSDTVSLLAGLGDGSFTLVQDVKVGENPTFVTVGDFDGDKIEDLAVIDRVAGDAGVSILLGNGDGTFKPASRVPLEGTPPTAMVLGDFNEDSIPDLAILSSRVVIVLGNGDGTFQPFLQVQIPGPGSPSSIAIGDLNGDKHHDLVTTAYSLPTAVGTVAVFLGRGDGTFDPSQSIRMRAPRRVAIGDFNADAIPDLVVEETNESPPTLRPAWIVIFRGRGDGSFQSVQSDILESRANQALSLAVGDFNGDGIDDVAAASANSNRVLIWLANGDGTLRRAQAFETGNGPRSITTGDFNREGRTDVAVTNRSANTISILINTTGHRFGQMGTVSSTAP